jgi:hypothetical protein
MATRIGCTASAEFLPRNMASLLAKWRMHAKTHVWNVPRAVASGLSLTEGAFAPRLCPRQRITALGLRRDLQAERHSFCELPCTGEESFCIPVAQFYLDLMDGLAFPTRTEMTFIQRHEYTAVEPPNRQVVRMTSMKIRAGAVPPICCEARQDNDDGHAPDRVRTPLDRSRSPREHGGRLRATPFASASGRCDRRMSASAAIARHS